MEASHNAIQTTNLRRRLDYHQQWACCRYDRDQVWNAARILGHALAALAFSMG